MNPMVESIYILTFSYFVYSLAHFEVFQVSGDIAIFFFAMVLSYYNKYNQSVDGAADIQVTLSACGQIAELFVYFY